MSKAFTSEETDEAPIVVRPRAPLPEGVPNYVTPGGLAALEAELVPLRAQSQRDPAIAGRVKDLEARIATAQVVDPATQPHDEIRFGATVELEADGGVRKRYQLVGVDEADAKHGKIAFTAPLARALLGRKAGEAVTVRTPRGDEELTVISIA